MLEAGSREAFLRGAAGAAAAALATVVAAPKEAQAFDLGSESF